jgi:hypothetical protein
MWAAAPVSGEFKAPEDRLKLSRSIEFMRCGFSCSEWLNMSRYISTVYVKCRNGSLKPASGVAGFSPGGIEVGHKLESLILAQNERWRHA